MAHYYAINTYFIILIYISTSVTFISNADIRCVCLVTLNINNTYIDLLTS